QRDYRSRFCDLEVDGEEREVVRATVGLWEFLEEEWREEAGAVVSGCRQRPRRRSPSPDPTKHWLFATSSSASLSYPPSLGHYPQPIKAYGATRVRVPRRRA
ncbi:unnamed protein product, partial [Scytosiphon promiscuus]